MSIERSQLQLLAQLDEEELLPLELPLELEDEDEDDDCLGLAGLEAFGLSGGAGYSVDLWEGVEEDDEEEEDEELEEELLSSTSLG